MVVLGDFLAGFRSRRDRWTQGGLDSPPPIKKGF